MAQLRSTMRRLKAPPTRTPQQTRTHVSGALASCTHVFVRHDAVRTPLRQPYDGPFKVLRRQDKFYTIDIKGRKDTVSLDRLKPAYLESTALEPGDTHASTPTHAAHTSPTPQPQGCPIQPSTRSTRASRHVHWPK